jgi:hypothetical protein
MSKRNTTRPTIAAGFFLATGVLLAGSAPSAHADPHTHDMYLMCLQLASDPTVAGVDTVVGGWVAQHGHTTANDTLGAQTLSDAVTYTCPEYQALVKAWLDMRENQGGTRV